MVESRPEPPQEARELNDHSCEKGATALEDQTTLSNHGGVAEFPLGESYLQSVVGSQQSTIATQLR